MILQVMTCMCCDRELRDTCIDSLRTRAERLGWRNGTGPYGEDLCPECVKATAPGAREVMEGRPCS
jgi:hypothetical protein